MTLKTSDSLRGPILESTPDNQGANVEDANEKLAPVPEPLDADIIPNGGFVAWYQVAGSFFLFMNYWGVINTFGVYQTFYETNLLAGKENSFDISWIGSVQAFLLISIGVVTGPLFDRGYFRHLIFVGSFLVVFGMMMTSICTEYWQIMLAQGITVGLGSGCLFVPSLAILPTYFTTKKATVLGIASSGSSFGGVIYPIVFHKLQPLVGFGWATRIIGFLILATLLVPLVGMRTRSSGAAPARKLVEWDAWKDPPFTLFACACFFAFMGLYIPFYYIGLYAIQKGASANLAFYLVAVLNAGSCFGRIIPSYIADRTGPLNMIVPCCLACVILDFAWLAIDNTPGIIVFCVLYGFFSGCFLAVGPAVVVTLSPSLNSLGARMGMNFGQASIGLLIGNPIAGAILGANSSSYQWDGLIGWAGACITVASIFILLTRVTKAGWGLMEKV